MPGPPKITLAHAKESGGEKVLFYCTGLFVDQICFHSGQMDLDAAIGRWGAETRLDQIPARCTRCGSRDHVDVRVERPYRPGDISKFIDRWRDKAS